MTRTIQASLLLALSLSLPLSLGGCEKKAETVNPDEAEEDPMVQLQAIPTRLQAEVDGVLQPINDAETLLGELETIPERYAMTAADFKGLVQASFDSETGTVELSADLHVAEDAKAELLATIAKLREIKIGLQTTPERTEVAVENVIQIGIEGIGLATQLLATLQAKLMVAIGEQQNQIAAQIQEVTAIKDQLTTQVEDIKGQLIELPGRAAEVGARFTASFAGSAEAG